MNALWLQGWGVSLNFWRKLISPYQKLLTDAYPQIRHFDIEFFQHSFGSRNDGKLIQKPESFLDQILQVIDKEEGDWIIVGWSLGGMLALETAYERPERIIQLILFSTALRFVRTPENPGGIQKTVLELMSRQVKRNPAQTLRQYYHLMFSEQEKRFGLDSKFLGFYSERSPRSPDRTGEMGWGSGSWNIPALVWGLEYLMRFDFQTRWVHLSLPILWIHGKDDPVCPCPDPAELLRGGTGFLKTLNNVGHVPFFTRSEDVKKIWELRLELKK